MIRNITIQSAHGPLHAQLDRPDSPRGLVLLASPLRAAVDSLIAANLAARGYAILAAGLLSTQEAQFGDALQNVPRLAQRIIDFLDLIRHDGDMQELPLAVFASGETTPAAIRAAAQRDTQIKVLACHGGIADRAGLQSLQLLAAPLLMLFDADDASGRSAFQRAAAHLGCSHETHVLGPGEDPVLRVAAWLALHLGS